MLGLPGPFCSSHSLQSSAAERKMPDAASRAANVYIDIDIDIDTLCMALDILFQGSAVINNFLSLWELRLLRSH